MNFREGKKEKKGIQTTTIVVMDCVLGSVTVSEGILRGSITFHVALSLEHDERVAPTAAVLVAHDSHPLNAAEALELSPEVVLGSVLMLWKRSDMAVMKW